MYARCTLAAAVTAAEEEIVVVVVVVAVALVIVAPLKVALVVVALVVAPKPSKPSRTMEGASNTRKSFSSAPVYSLCCMASFPSCNDDDKLGNNTGEEGDNKGDKATEWISYPCI